MIFEPEAVSAVDLAVFEPEVVSAVDLAIFEPGVVSAVDLATFEPGVVSAVDLAVSEPEVVSAVDLAVSELEVVFAAAVSIPGVAEPRASLDIAFAFASSVAVPVVSIEVYNSAHPMFFAFPNAADFASSSNFCEGDCKEWADNSTGARSNDALCSIFSNRGLYQNRILGLYRSNATLGHNTVSDTSALPMDATTSHHRKRYLHLR